MSNPFQGIQGAQQRPRGPQQAQPPQPPPSAGAIDLGALKGRAEAEVEQIKQYLLQNGFPTPCDCGQEISEHGVQLQVLTTGIVPTQAGPQIGLNVNMVYYCSRECSHLSVMLENLPTDSKVVAIRKIPATEWIVPPPWVDRNVVDGEAA